MPLDCMAWRVEKGLLNKKTTPHHIAKYVAQVCVSRLHVCRFGREWLSHQPLFPGRRSTPGVQALHPALLPMKRTVLGQCRDHESVRVV